MCQTHPFNQRDAHDLAARYRPARQTSRAMSAMRRMRSTLQSPSTCLSFPSATKRRSCKNKDAHTGTRGRPMRSSRPSPAGHSSSAPWRDHSQASSSAPSSQSGERAAVGPWRGSACTCGGTCACFGPWRGSPAACPRGDGWRLAAAPRPRGAVRVCVRRMRVRGGGVQHRESAAHRLLRRTRSHLAQLSCAWRVEGAQNGKEAKVVAQRLAVRRGVNELVQHDGLVLHIAVGDECLLHPVVLCGREGQLSQRRDGKQVKTQNGRKRGAPPRGAASRRPSDAPRSKR